MKTILSKKSFLLNSFYLLVLLATPPALHAQFYVGVHGGISLPQGLYAESRMSDNEWMFAEGHQLKAGAGKGWSAGIELSYAMPFHPNLEISFIANYLQSPANRDVRNYYESVYPRRYAQCSLYEMELPRFRYIPLFLGVRYSYPLAGEINLYAEALAGANIRIISDWFLACTLEPWSLHEELAYPEYNNVDLRSYSPATTFAFRLGMGVLIKKKYTLGASYQMLGKAPLAWERTTINRNEVYGQVSEYTNQSNTEYTNLSPTLFLIELGYRLAPFKTRSVQDW